MVFLASSDLHERLRNPSPSDEPELMKPTEREEPAPIAAADSAIHRAPLETLGDIFAFAIPKTLNEDGRNALLNLCLVCKFWREAALQTHYLWNDVQLDCSGGVMWDPFQAMTTRGDARGQDKSRGSLDPKKVLAWFKRSGTLPKSLELNITSNTTLASVKTGVMFTRIAMLLEEIMDFEKLSLSFPTSDFFDRFITEFRGPEHNYDRPTESDAAPTGWQRLQVKELVLTFRMSRFLNKESGLSDQEIPGAVQRLQLDLGTNQVFRLGKPGLPPTLSRRLTSLNLTVFGWSLNLLVHVIGPCAALNELTLDLCQGGDAGMYGGSLPPIYTDEEGLVEISKVHLPHLRMLALKRTDIVGLKVLDVLSAPKLEQLELEFMDRVVSTYGYRNAQFKPFPDTLTSLRVANFELAQGWERLLGPGRGCPVLKNLTLDKIKLPVTQDNDHLPAFWERYTTLEKLEILNIEAASFDLVKQLSLFIAYEGPPGRPVASNGRVAKVVKYNVAPMNPSLRSLKITFAEKGSDGRKLWRKEHDSKTFKAVLEKTRVLRREGGMAVCVGPRFV